MKAYEGLSFQSVHLNDSNFNGRHFHFEILTLISWEEYLNTHSDPKFLSWSLVFPAVALKPCEVRGGDHAEVDFDLQVSCTKRFEKEPSSLERWKRTSNIRDKSLEGSLMTRLEERKLIYCRHTDLLLWKSKQMETILLSPIWLTWCLFQALPILPSLSLLLESSTALSLVKGCWPSQWGLAHLRPPRPPHRLKLAQEEAVRGEPGKAGYVPGQTFASGCHRSRGWCNVRRVWSPAPAGPAMFDSPAKWE